MREAPGCLPIVPPATWLMLFTACPTLGRTPVGAALRVQHSIGRAGEAWAQAGQPVPAGVWVCATQGSWGGVCTLFPTRRMPCVRVTGRGLLQS